AAQAHSSTQADTQGRQADPQVRGGGEDEEDGHQVDLPHQKNEKSTGGRDESNRGCEDENDRGCEDENNRGCGQDRGKEDPHESGLQGHQDHQSHQGRQEEIRFNKITQEDNGKEKEEVT
ncbi:MAG: hypothetical protein ACYTFA_19440, partial [Planctomycetota bacterium]